MSLGFAGVWRSGINRTIKLGYGYTVGFLFGMILNCKTER